MKRELQMEIEPQINQHSLTQITHSKNKDHPLKHFYKPPPKQDYSTNFAKLIIVIIISLVFIAGQFVGGYISNSISVISDAFHLVTDLIGFIVSFVFIYFSRKESTNVMSFGYHRMEIIGGLGNLFIIWALAIFLYYQATLRIIDKQFVKEPLAMLIVAAVGLAINIVMYFVLHSGGHSHGLMSQPCSHDHGHKNSGQGYQCCNDSICDDEQCLKVFAYQQHCHVKIGNQKSQIHRHQKVAKRKNSNDASQQNAIAIKMNDDNQQAKKKLEELNINFTIHQHSVKCQTKKPSLKVQNAHQQHNHEHDSHGDHKCNHKNQNHNHGDHKHENHKNGDHNCKDYNHDNHNHGHDHDHDHDHDHNHDHQHQHGQIHHQGGQSISMKAAVLHALSDVIQSIGLLISSIIIFFAGSNMGAPVTQWNDWHYLDPISTYIFSTIVIISTWPVTKNCYYLIMQATPLDIQIEQVQKQFEEIQGVIDVHDLHIWQLRPAKRILICHVFAKLGKQRQVLQELTLLCRKKKIYHSTIQVQQQQYKDHNEYIKCDHDIH